MVLRFFAFATVLLFFGCSSSERDNPFDAKGKNTSLKNCNDMFNSDTHFCYDGAVYALCNGMDYNPTAYYCDFPMVRAAICGIEEYNPLIQRCKSDIVETKCGTGWYNAINQRCGLNNIIETECGEAWYDSTDVNLRCQSDIVETKCGTGSNYHNPAIQFCDGNNVINKCNGEVYAPAIQRCQSNIIENKCGEAWYDSANVNLRCQSDIVEAKCGDIWYNIANFRCQSNIIETKCGEAWYDSTNVNLRCQSDIVETKCGEAWYDSTNVNLRCQSDIVEVKCGEAWYNIINQRCGSDNIVDTKCGEVWYNQFSNKYCLSNSLIEKGVKGEFIDSRDGKTYKAVEFNSQIWMAENLNYTAEGSKCNGDNTGGDSQNRCSTYGRLYDWATAMGIGSTYNNNLFKPDSTIKHRGVCPIGWHVPSDTEWSLLINYVSGGSPTAGKILKATSGWSSSNGASGNGADTYGFSALPGGYGYPDGGFSDIGGYGDWWSASEYEANYAYSRSMYSSTESADRRTNGSKTYLYSVRCVQD